MAPILWNVLPPEGRQGPTPQAFEKGVKTFLQPCVGLREEHAAVGLVNALKALPLLFN